MPPTPPDTTNRLKVLYEGPFGQHTMLFHGVTGVTEADLTTAVRAVLNAMKMCVWSAAVFNGAEYAPAGSTIFNPVSWADIFSGTSTSPTAYASPSAFLQWGGRDLAGKRVKLYLFETLSGPRNDMRYSAGEDSTIAAVTTALAAASGIIGTIAGGSPVWKNYVNVGQNDYLTHRARG